MGREEGSVVWGRGLGPEAGLLGVVMAADGSTLWFIPEGEHITGVEPQTPFPLAPCCLGR